MVSKKWHYRMACIEAEILAVACPYETPRFEDACKNIDKTGKLRVLDIAELLVFSMGL